ncbi:MAG: ATP-binding protein, partial [Nitrospirota bacterium]
MPYNVKSTIVRNLLNTSLSTKLILTFLIVVTVPIVFFAIFSEKLIAKKVHEEIRKATDQNLETVWLQYYVRADQMRYGMLQATEAVERGIQEHDQLFLRNKMTLWKNTRPYVDVWIIVDRESKVIARLNSNTAGDFFELNGVVEKAMINNHPVISTEVMPKELLLMEGENSAKEIVIPIRKDGAERYDPGRGTESDALMLTVVVPVMDENNVIGAIITGDILNKDNFIPNAILSKIPGSMVTIAKDGVSIATTITDINNGMAIGTLLPAVVMSYINQGKGFRGDTLVEGEKYITSFDPIKDNKGNTIGSLFIGVAEATFTELHKDSRHNIFLAMIMGILFAGGAAVFVSKALTRSLNTLVEKSKEVGSGNLDAVIPIDTIGETKDEVAILARSFNYMLTGLKERSVERETHLVELEKKSNDLSALNEKLQATNQELEVSLEEAQSQQEELQSANEELIILNEELEKKSNDLFEANMKIMEEEEELRQTKDKLQLIYDGINDYIFLLDPDCTILEVNKAFLDKYELKEKDVIGKKCFDLLYGCSDVLPECNVKQGANIEIPQRHRTTTKDKRIVERYVFPIRDSKGYLVNRIEYIRDITEETMLREQLAQAEKLTSLGEILSGIAHELNNPLTGVLGYCELLQETSQDKSMKEQLGKINDAAVRCKKIIENLLSFARQHKIEKKYCDINDIIKRTLELKVYQLRIDNIDIYTDLSPDIPNTMADTYSLQQVFLNLINNAHLAMVDKKTPGVLSIKSEQVNGVIRIIISDTGVGIAEESLSKIFNPFFSTREVGKGTGLGLSISYGIIKEHNGKIYATSKPGVGTSFFVEIPVVNQMEVNPDTREKNGYTNDL